MTPDTLAATGRALYGERWQTALAHDLGVTDRTLRRWLAGANEMPPTIAAECRRLLVERQASIAELLAA